MEFRCKLSEVDELEWRLREAVKEPLRTYEGFIRPRNRLAGGAVWSASMIILFMYPS